MTLFGMILLRELKMSKYILVFTVLLVGCGKVSDTFTTFADGYTLKCIDGTSYVMMTSERGLAVTPHVDLEGKPRGCVK